MILNLLTIRYDRAITNTSINVGLNTTVFLVSNENALYKLTIVKNRPAIVIGIPWNTLLNGVTLYRASRYAPAIGNVIGKIYPNTPHCMKLIFQAIIIGATPNDIRSDRESNCFPNSLTTSKCLAAFPSNLSVTAASIMSSDALIKRLMELFLCDWQDKRIATTPKDKLIKVNIFGIAFL